MCVFVCLCVSVCAGKRGGVEVIELVPLDVLDRCAVGVMHGFTMGSWVE